MRNTISRCCFSRCATFVAIALGVCFYACIAVAAPSFDEQRKTVSASPATQPEDTIISLLQAGIAEDKPTQAIAVTRLWLRQNVAENPLLLYHAGRAAELSGDWRSAVALYQQYLKRADLKSDTARTAVFAVYTLLLDQLNDAEGAYAYMSNEGHRLHVCGRARQFDQWYLDTAISRRDHDAVAARLLACVNDPGTSDDLLIARYDGYFRWLLDTITGYRLDVPRFSPQFAANVKALAAGITFDDELKLRLDWVVSVKQYIMNVLDGNEALTPVAEARALLQRYPRYAELVQTGWAGGHRGRHYKDDPKKYWPIDLEAKLAPVKVAASKLGPLEHADFIQSWGSGYYDSGPQVLSVEEARAFVLANPKIAGSRSGPPLGLGWNTLSVEEARKLAPHLEQNPSPEASLVRAIVAGGEEKDFDKAMKALLGPEAWRLGQRELGGYYADQLWHWCGRPGGSPKRDREIAKSKALAATFANGDVKKEDPVAKRLATFKKLWADFRSPQPKIPAVRWRLVMVLQVTPEALPELLRDKSPEAQMLARETIAGAISGPDEVWAAYGGFGVVNVHRYDPCILRMAKHHGDDVARFRQRYPEKYKPHPLEPVLRKAVADRMKQNKVEPWLAMAWINTRFPEDNEESLKLMAALFKSPVYKTLPYEVRFGARAWFKNVAMTAKQYAYVEASDPTLFCKDLIELMEPPEGWTPKPVETTKPSDDPPGKPSYRPDAAKTVAALRKAIEGIAKSPVCLEIMGLDQLAAVEDEVFTDPKVMDLMLQIAGPLRTFHRSGHSIQFDERLLRAVIERGQPDVLHRTAPYFWRHTELHHRPLPTMMSLAESLVEVNPSAASAWARCGLQTIARHHSGHTYYSRETDVPRLKSIRGKAALAMGLIEVPVPPTDPAYPIYRSQAEFAIGNEDSARELYDANADRLLPVHRNLSVPYLLWALQRTIDRRDEPRQEELVKALLAWSQESTTAFSLDQKIALEIAYGDIAMQRRMLPEAHKIFAGIQKNTDYDGIVAQHTATLRRARVERISKDFDAALKTLAELELQRIPQVTTGAHLTRAEVYYDMEQYDAAADEIAKVLQRDPTHADAIILRGRVQLKRKRLIEATELEVGTVSSQTALVPGEALKVTLNDPTLSVSSGGSDIEVVVWSTSGDKEHLLLRQFGDQKTKYRGEVKTALGRPEPGDKTLQVVGDDEIFYAYSEEFRRKATGLGANRGGPITVASDAMLMASARRLLSENEQRVADMEAVTAALESKQGPSVENTAPSVLAQMKAEAVARARQRAIRARVKPGNPIHLRVIDPDRGRTAEIDELVVSAVSSSGDSIGRVVLKETGTHAGRFEGSVPTAGAQAMAFGSTSEAGRNPNVVISPKATYPAWRPVASKDAEHSFTVDLNDNAPLGSLEIEAKDAGFALKSFLVQTAMNHESWTTVARYPANPIAVENPWHPSVTVMNDTDRYHTGGRTTVYALNELVHHVERGWMTQQYAQGIAQKVTGPSEALPGSIPGALKWKRQGRHDNSHVVYRFEAYFCEPTDVTRRFRLVLGKYEIPKDTHPSMKSPPQFLLAVDGRPITKEGGKLEGELPLRPGLHKFEIWAIGWVMTGIGFGRTTKLQVNLEGNDGLVDCPDSFFDPKTFPEGVLEHRNSPAAIAVGDDGTKFHVTFAEDSRARLLRIVFVDQEGPVPSLNRLTLTRPDGDTLLPVPRDYAELRKNDSLEILTGDTITVRYVDDRYVTKGKQKHERFLNVAFTDGRAEFADIEPRFSSRHGKKMPYHERLLRFEYGKPLTAVIYDADMDVSVEPDQVICTIESKAGGGRELIATETGPSTGIFKAVVVPVGQASSLPSHAGPQAGSLRHVVAEGGTLRLVYLDAENASPGVPVDRYASSRHAAFQKPTIEVAHVTVSRVEPGSAGPAQRLCETFIPDELAVRSGRRLAIEQRIVPRFEVTQTFVDAKHAPQGGIELVHGRLVLIDVIAPQLALGTASTVSVYVQTDGGRKLASSTGGSADQPFDLDVPGTIRLTGQLGEAPRNGVPLRAGYLNVATEGGSFAGGGTVFDRIKRSYDAGRFRAAVPLIAGMLPEHSYADPEKIRQLRLPRQYGLVARTGERIHIGFSYKDRDGKTQWVTTSAKVITHPMLDVMQEGYRTRLTKAFVGERVHLRVIDLAQDRTDRRDTVRIYMASKSGQKHYAHLRETGAHTGVFKGTCQLTYASADSTAAENAAEYDVRRLGFPVVYGDTLGVRYTDPSGRKTPPQYVTIGKGSDGTIAPFSKQYDDSETAMHTQFAMAESYLELARRHRKLGQAGQAAREFVRAKQLLEGAIHQFHDPETRAHAEYLLGSLTQEDAEGTADRELREARYHAALARFMKVTGTYPDAQYASKAQFKIAVIYERLKESDIAAQEYVKLAYKYPESEHLATAMARLGTHFQRKAAAYETEAKPLLAMADDKDAQHKGTALQTLARLDYVKSAQVFERLQARFPDHELAGKAGLRAGQTYMRAEKYAEAITALERVIDDESYDGKTLRSEAMYWAGRCHQTLNQQLQAYALYKRITYDFPESKWAAYARGQLSTERLLQLDRQLEIERLEEGRR